MLLTPTEMERLVIYTAAELARRRRAKGLKLNHPEAVALISDEILEGAREGRSVADLMGYGSTILTTDDVLPGVAAMLPILQVEGMFDDGTKLVTVHEPIRPPEGAPADALEPGAITALPGDIELNAAARPRGCASSTPGTGRSRSARTTISSKSIARWTSIARPPTGFVSTFLPAPRCGSNRGNFEKYPLSASADDRNSRV